MRKTKKTADKRLTKKGLETKLKRQKVLVESQMKKVVAGLSAKKIRQIGKVVTAVAGMAGTVAGYAASQAGKSRTTKYQGIPLDDLYKPDDPSITIRRRR